MGSFTLDNSDPRNPEEINTDSIPNVNPVPSVPGTNNIPGVNTTPRADIGDLEDREGFEIIETDEPGGGSRTQSP